MNCATLAIYNFAKSLAREFTRLWWRGKITVFSYKLFWYNCYVNTVICTERTLKTKITLNFGPQPIKVIKTFFCGFLHFFFTKNPTYDFDSLFTDASEKVHWKKLFFHSELKRRGTKTPIYFFIFFSNGTFKFLISNNYNFKKVQIFTSKFAINVLNGAHDAPRTM